MNFVWRKATTSKSKYTPSDFADLKKMFLQSVVETVTMEEILPQLILNWDQIGIKLFLHLVGLWKKKVQGELSWLA